MLSGGKTNATFNATFDPTLLHPMLRSFGHPVFNVNTIQQCCVKHPTK